VATAAPEALATLSTAHQAAQARRAAQMAALVAAYFKVRVNISDPQSVQTWLEIMLPKILGSRSESERIAAQYGDAVRRLEMPNLKDDFTFAKASVPGLDPAVVRTSLNVTGPVALQKKLTVIERLDPAPTVKQAMITEAKNEAAGQVGGAVARHVQNGGRDILKAGVAQDKVALGYVRVLKSEKPCFFCTMLASRGPVFQEDSFSDSDPRFEGPHHFKVHDSCACSLKPVYHKTGDPMVDRVQPYVDMWADLSDRKGSAPTLLEWRQEYEGRSKIA